MAKSYIDILKYMVEAKFEISGMVEKPDIVGAVFGQTEGLLGSDLDLRELQKNGKIGRIEVDVTTTDNKTYGRLFLPSSLPRVDTCILSAAIESVDKVGPFDTTFKVEKIEDTRNEKRRKIVSRAKELLQRLLETEMPDSKELSEMVESNVKTANIMTYGSDNLPSGPGISKSEEVILVEGRADVVNLLRNDIENCIAIGGATGSVPRTIIDLCATKEATLFVDGDRGGEMIIKSIMGNAEIDFIARAPDGKEVEELTRKEIIKALRSRVPVDQFIPSRSSGGRDRRPPPVQRAQQHERYPNQPQQRPPQSNSQTGSTRESIRDRERPTLLSPTEISENMKRPSAQENRERRSEKDLSYFDIKSIDESENGEGMDSITPILQKAVSDSQPVSSVQKKEEYENSKIFMDSLIELKNTLRGRVYDSDGKMIKEVPVREIIQTIQDINATHTLVFDGIITQRLVELAHKQGIKAIYGIRSNPMIRKFDDLAIFTMEEA